MKEIPKPNIVDVLEELGGQVVGRGSGSWQKARCPLHEDSNPSASVNEDECRFNCFSCDFNGDAVDLIMKAEDVGFATAVERAKGFPGGSDGGVRGEPSPRAGVPHRQGDRKRGNGSFVPIWRRL